MKKMLASVLVGTMVLSLAACGNSQTSGATESKGASTEAAGKDTTAVKETEEKKQQQKRKLRVGMVLPFV